MSERTNRLLKATQRQDRTIVQREEDGKYQIGWLDDADGPFESRRFAEAVAGREVRYAQTS